MQRGILQPQEVEVYYIIPVIRKELALAMKEDGMEQKKIAELLGVTPSAISQYLSNKRAADIEVGDVLRKKIRASVKHITSPISLIGEMQKLIKVAKQNKILCRVHEKLGGAPEGCDVCF